MDSSFIGWPNRKIKGVMMVMGIVSPQRNPFARSALHKCAIPSRSLHQLC